MTHLYRVVALATLALVAAPASAFADVPPPPLPTNEQALQKQLQTFDPGAVAAARHYYESPKVKDGILSVLTSLYPAIIANQEKASGKKLSDADRMKLLAVLNRAMNENFDFLLRLNMVAALETLSTEQLVALDQFYSSPVGQGILDKMPKVSQRMPAIMQVFAPKFLGSVQALIEPASAATP